MRLSTLFATLGLALVMTLGLSAQTVRVIFVSGQASLQRPDEAALRPALKGETVIIGTRIVTGADGRVVLTPMPGVKSIITPNTTLLLESVSENRTSATEVTHQAVLDLKEGAVVSDLQKPEGVTYDYSIRTARGLAGARGTTFTVGINAAGIQTIVVAHGTISINFTDGRSATLSLGQLSITKASGETQSVNNVTDLPEADQKVAQTWAETTIAAIATALEAGIELDTEALNNALDAAKSLGITLSPETQAAVDRALTSLNDTAGPLDPHKKSNPIIFPEIVTEIITETDALSLFRSRLSADQLAVFDALPDDIQKQFVTLNDLDITAVALAPDRESGLPLTHQDLRIHLAAFIQLSDEALAFVKTLAGANLSNFDGTPDPAGWSPEAFERTLTSWNSLSSTERTMITTLGAGEAIMDTSADYISGLLGSLDSTQRSIITQTGWGEHLAELAGKPTGSNIFQIVGEYLDASDRAAVKYFDISPDYFNNYSIIYIVDALAEVSAANQQILLQLGIADVMLEDLNYHNSSALVPTEGPNYAANIANALSFYGSLSSSEKTAARALGLGGLFYKYAPNQTIGDGNVTALQRIKQLTQFYINNPSLQQAMRDSELFSESYFLYHSEAINTSELTSALNTYVNLPERTRVYLSVLDHSYSFFSLANPGEGTTTYRTLSAINSLLGSLSSAEFATLLDLDLGKAVIERGYYTYDYETSNYVITPYFSGTPLAAIKETIGYFNQLDSGRKFVLRELGILGDSNVAVVGADTDGLDRLLTAYAALPGTLRATTERLDEYNTYGSTYGNLGNPGTPVNRSYFFPRGYDKNYVMQNVAFESTGNLHVGATRYLRINNDWLDGDTFTVGANKNLYLYASDLIDLQSTGFSSDIRSITMAAATINLTNINFPDGSVASLNSRLGQVAFLGFEDSPIPGKINFKNVSYGYNSLNSAGDLTSIYGANGNIAIGTLKNPAKLPTYTPVANPQ